MLLQLLAQRRQRLLDEKRRQRELDMTTTNRPITSTTPKRGRLIRQASFTVLNNYKCKRTLSFGFIKLLNLKQCR